MAELNLRVSVEVHERIESVCIRHGLGIAEFCRKTAKQYYSGKIKPVVEHELLKATTYNGKIIQSWKWEFELNGKELLAVLIAAIIKLENIKAIKLPNVEEIEGIDCNIPIGISLQKVNTGEYDLPKNLRKKIRR